MPLFLAFLSLIAALSSAISPNLVTRTDLPYRRGCRGSQREVIRFLAITSSISDKKDDRDPVGARDLHRHRRGSPEASISRDEGASRDGREASPWREARLYHDGGIAGSGGSGCDAKVRCTFRAYAERISFSLSRARGNCAFREIVEINWHRASNCVSSIRGPW